MQNIELIIALIRKEIYLNTFDSQGTSRRIRKTSLSGYTDHISDCVSEGHHPMSWTVHLILPTQVPQTLEPPLQWPQICCPCLPVTSCDPRGSCLLTLFLHSLFEISLSCLWWVELGTHTCYLVFRLLPWKSGMQDRNSPDAERIFKSVRQQKNMRHVHVVGAVRWR